MVNRTRHGFTLVELIVVIIVIGILAAITIIAYPKIANRAHTTVELSDAAQWVQALSIYEGKHGSYPVLDGNGGATTCLGTSFPATADFAEGVCYTYASSGQVLVSISADPTINAELQKIAQLPDNAFPLTSISTSGVTVKDRGILYIANTTPFIDDGTGTLYRASVYYYTLGSDTTCGTGVLGSSVLNGVTFNVCNFYLK